MKKRGLLKYNILFFIFIMVVMIMPMNTFAKSHDFSLQAVDFDVTGDDWNGTGTGDEIADNDYLEPGQIFQVNVYYSPGDAGALGFQFALNYDNSLLEPVSDGGELYLETDMTTDAMGGVWPAAGTTAVTKKKTNWTVTGNDTGSQIIVMAADGQVKTPFTAEGIVATVYFKLKDDAKAGSVINLSFDESAAGTVVDATPSTISTTGIGFRVFGTMGTDVSLSSLSLTGNNSLNYATNPLFTSGTSDRIFSIIVPNAVSSINIATTATDSLASVLAGGLGNKALTVGDNSFNLVVQAQNGTQEIYTIKIRRLSNDATLKTLTLSGVNLDYNLANSIYTYTATVPYATKNTVVSASTTNSEAVIKSGTGSWSFTNTGDTLNTKKITVEAEDCSSTYTSVPGNTCSSQDYTLNVTRTSPSSNNDLSDIKVEGTTVKNFSSNTTEYTLDNVSNGTSSLNVTATLADSKASVTGVGANSIHVGDNTITLIVTAEDGSKKLYNIKVRRLSNNANLKSLSVTSTPTGSLTPSFTSNFYKDYTYTYDSTVTSINVSAVVEDSNATITSGVGTYSSGDSGANVVVTAEDGTVTTYVIKFSRNKSSDNSLSSLSIDDYNLNEVFSSTKTLYTATVPGTVSSINVSAEATDSNAVIVSGLGSHSLNYGANTIQVRVRAENGGEKDYTLTVTRSKKTISSLSDLTINGVSVDKFSSTVLRYDYGTVAFATDSVTVGYTTTDSDATVTGGGKVNLKTGANKIDVVVTAHDGVTKTTYSIDVYRTLSNNAYLSNLSVTGSTIDFNKTKNDYSIEVPYETTSVNIVATAEYKDATVAKSGPSTLAVGDNNYNIAVTAEDGTINTYTLKVVRKLSTNVDLSNLIVTNSSKNYLGAFNKNTIIYDINVPNEVDNIDIGATLSDSTNQTISGDGNKTLTTGKNTFDVVVTAASGDTKTYKLNITRSLNSNNKLSSLVVVDQTLSPTFNPITTSYSVTVESNVSQVMIQAAADSSTSIIDGVGMKNLKTGTNTFNINVTAENNDVKTYVIVVTRKASNDSSLKSLSINEALLNETFSKDKTEYTASVGNSVSQITVSALANDDKAKSVTGVGVVNLATGDNTITVTVTAEDNTKTTYKVIVNRAKSLNANLVSIGLSNGYSLDQTFDKDTTSYTATVPNSMSKIQVSAIKEDSTATVTGVGEISLNTGNNTINITVTAEDSSIKKIYTVKIFRALSNNAYLKSLTSSDGVITPTFSKTTNAYFLTVPYEVENANLVATKEDNAATVNINGITNLKVGVNKATIVVTAEDGTINTYNLDITRQPSSNNYLSDLQVLDNNLKNYISVFSKTVTSYDVNVDNSISSINLVATKEDDATTVKGDGIKTLDVGKNTFTIESVSANGVTRKYIINVTRAKNSNNNLKSLEVEGQTIVPDFNSNEVSYSLSVDASVSKVKINAEAEVSTSVVSGTGEKDLHTGLNTFNIDVTAEDSTKKTYVIVVNKAASSNNYLASLLASEAFTPTFDRDTITYNATVGNSVTDITVQAVAEDANATVSGGGNHTLNVGNNSVLITVTAEDNTFRAYTINVYREPSSNNYLSDLQIDGKTIDNFNKTTQEYTMDVSNDVTQLVISGSVEDSTASISGEKTWYLNTGSNTTNLVVTAENGDTRIYKLTVTRAKSSNNNLSLLSALEGTLSPTFDKSVVEYQMSVPYEITSLSLTKVAEDANALVEVEGNVDFQIGSNNNVYIAVTAEDDSVKKYKIQVTRLPQANNFLSNLSVTTGGGKNYKLNPSFNKNTLNYTIDIDKNDNELVINGTKEASSATVTGLGNLKITSFPYVHNVSVTSAGGVERIYTITFNKIKSSNANLKELSVSEGVLSPSFQENVTSYNVEVDANVSSIDVSALGYDDSAIVGSGTHNLNYGSNAIQVSVTAEDGTLKNYTINVNRKREISSTLDNISVTSGQLNPEFSKEVTNYIAYISQDATNMVITPTISDIMATMSISVNDGAYQNISGVTLNDLTGENNVKIKVVGSNETTIYSIAVLTQSDEKITSEEYGHDISDGMIKTVKPDTTSDELKNQLDNDSSKLKIFKSNGIDEYTGDSPGTGMIMKLIVNDVVVDQKVIVVIGDTDGNGDINAIDALKVINDIIETEKLSGSYLVAADTTYDKNINAIDALKIINHIVGNERLD